MHPIRTEYGRDALSDTFGECVVAKANEADCGAQTPKSKHMRKGENSILGLFGEPVMIFNKKINQTYDKSGIKSVVKKFFKKN